MPVNLVGSGFPLLPGLDTLTTEGAPGDHLDLAVTVPSADDGGASSDLQLILAQESSSDFLEALCRWNAADKTANVTLSNNDYTATHNVSGAGGVRGTHGRSTGKRYFELFVPSTNHNTQFNIYGMATATWDETVSPYGTFDPTFRGGILGIYGGGGHFTMTNSTIRMAVDFPNSEFSISFNGGVIFIGAN